MKDIMELFMGHTEYDAEIGRLEELKKTFNTANKLHTKKCAKCGYCCHKRPCIPTPKEMEKIAKFFKLSVKGFVNKYCGIDKTNHGLYHIRILGINILDFKGKFIPNDKTFNQGKCIFLDDNNLCKIHTVKPREAKDHGCWFEEETFDGKIPWVDSDFFDKYKIEIED